MAVWSVARRELRALAKRPDTYWARAVLATAAVLVSGCLLWLGNYPSLDQLGRLLFHGLAWCSLLYCLLAGAWLAADCLSSERRAGTLGLLLLTRLSGLELVVGKLAGAAFRSVHGLIAVLPVLAVALLFGGVTLVQLGRVTLVLANALFFAVTIGVVASICHRSSLRAAFSATALVLLLTVLPIALERTSFLAVLREAGAVVPDLLLPCPAFALALTLFPQEGVDNGLWWQSSAMVQAVAWIGIGVVVLIVPRIRPVQASPAWKQRTLSALSPRRESPGLTRFQTGRQMLDMDPCLWVNVRDKARLAPLGSILWVAAALFTFIGSWYLDISISEEILAVAAFGLQLGLKVWIVATVVNRTYDDCHSGAAELVLTTPVGPSHLVRGHLRACWRRFAGLVAAVLATDVLFCWLTLQAQSAGAGLALGFYFVSMVSLVADAWVLAWVSLWSALSSRNRFTALVGSLAVVLAPPWVGCLLAGGAWTALGVLPGRPPPAEYTLWLWLGLVLFWDWGCYRHARRRLSKDFLRAVSSLRCGLAAGLKS